MGMSVILFEILVLGALALAILAVFQSRAVQLSARRIDEVCGPPRLAATPGAATENRAGLWRRFLASNLLARHVREEHRHILGTYCALLVAACASCAFFVGWLAGVVLGLTGVLGYLVIARWLMHKQARAFVEQLPAFLERVRQLVLIGNTLPHAFSKSAALAEPVLKRKLDPVIRRMNHGMPFADALDALADRMNIAELHMLSASVRTNAKFGGRVAHTLDTLITQVTHKIRLEREIRAATAETRASALALALLSTSLFAYLLIANQHYLSFFLNSQSGRILLTGIVGWPMIGAIVMRRILKLDF